MSIDIDIRNMKKDYNLSVLNESSLKSNPLDLFGEWLNEAIKYGVKEPNAMVLSTVSNNKPKSRVVLLKQVLDGKFIFFTNYNSNKGKEIEENPNVCLTFFLDELQKQVRVEGVAKKSSENISDEYFSMRAKESQIAAWVSSQSEVTSEKQLQDNLLFYSEKFKNTHVPRPAHWGAYEIEATSIEFWQGGANRLHNRFLYELINNNWEIKRLSP